MRDFQTFLYYSDYTKEYQNFRILKGEMAFSKTFFNKFTLNLQSEVGFTVGEQTVPFFDFVLGGYGYNMINNFTAMIS